jgi:hypothetical protein
MRIRAFILIEAVKIDFFQYPKNVILTPHSVKKGHKITILLMPNSITNLVLKIKY